MKPHQFLSLLVFPLLSMLATDASMGQNSLSVTSDKFIDDNGSSVSVEIVSAFAGQVSLRTIYPPEIVAGAGPGQYAKPATNSQDLSQRTRVEASLEVLANLFRTKTTRSRVLLSGGYSGYRDDIPVGLLITGGRVQSSLDTSPRRVAKTQACSVANPSLFRFSGILCVAATSGEWQILRTSDYIPGMCREALQAGPLLVEPGGVQGICDDTDTVKKVIPYSRMAACIDKNRDLHFISSAPIRLHSFARWLAEGRLKCDVALNLTGDFQAGWVELASPRMTEPRFHGKVAASLASAILLEERPVQGNSRKSGSSETR